MPSLISAEAVAADPFRYSVGTWDRSGQRDRWIPFGYFDTPLKAMRAARRLRDSHIRRGLWVGTVNAIRIGGGTVFDLEFFFPSFIDRRYYMRLQEYLNF